MHGKFIRTIRTPEISTSSIIQRVVRNREKFILALVKRGYTLKQLNVSKTYYGYMKLKSILRRAFTCCTKKPKSSLKNPIHSDIDRGVIYKSEL